MASWQKPAGALVYFIFIIIDQKAMIATLHPPPVQITSNPSSPMVDWQPGSPIPCDNYVDHRDTPPEELSFLDVQRIWWIVASRFEYGQLRDALLPVIKFRRDWGCFIYQPIAELAGRCCYPKPVIKLLSELLPKGVIISVDDEESRMIDVYNMLIIQADIWHELTWKAFELCPLEALSDELLEIRLARDIGL